MLLSLSFQNYIIIDDLTIDFTNNFHVITGETGAGKSIILNGLGLLLGEKADYSQIKYGKKQAIISALFNIANLDSLKLELEEQGLIDESNNDELIIRRIIDNNNKSKSFINGQLVSLSQLKSIGLLLIDIHGQHEHYSLNSDITQRKILDAYANTQNLVLEIKEIYSKLKISKENLEKAKEQKKIYEDKLTDLQNRYQELEALNFNFEEWEEQSSKFDLLANSAEIITKTQEIENIIESDYNGLLSQVIYCKKLIEQFNNINNSKLNNSLEILDSIEVELNEVSSNVRDIYQSLEINPDDLSFLEERINLVLSICKKYQIEPITIIDFKNQVKDNIEKLQSSYDLDLLSKEVLKYEKSYEEKANILSNLRKVSAEKLTKEITSILHELAMPSIVFKIDLVPIDNSSYGKENINFLVATNKNTKLNNLAKIASGGELSRISLAIQVVMSNCTKVPTLIFDEVDSGISGKIAQIVGSKLYDLGKLFQIIVITHLPQVAAYGNHHYLVQKIEHDNNEVNSYIKKLTNEERITEIARMLSGTEITDTAINHAKKLLNHNSLL